MKHIITYIFLCLLFVTCDKKDPLFNGLDCNGNCYILEGRLIEKQTSNPLSNIELKIYFKPSRYTLTNNVQYLGRTITKTDGTYTFKFNSDKYVKSKGYFYIEGGKKGYIYKVYDDKASKELLNFDLDSTMINVPQKQSLELYKEAKLSIRVKATTITNFQFLTVTYSFGTSGYGKVFNGGQVIDQSNIYITAADWPTIIQYDAVGNGIKITKKDTLIVPSNGASYEINL